MADAAGRLPGRHLLPQQVRGKRRSEPGTKKPTRGSAFARCKSVICSV